MKQWIKQGTKSEGFPTIHIVSDSLGKTAEGIAIAVAAAFGNLDPAIETLPEVTHVRTLEEELEGHFAHHESKYPGQPFVLFYTLVEPETRAFIEKFIAAHDQVEGIDLLGAPIEALRRTSGRELIGQPGSFRVTNDRYFKRIEAIEFTIAHDDGNRPDELAQADIVLIGVSRSSKTPLSVYLSQLGYRVANIPLDPQTEPPHEIYDVDSRRLYGLMTSPDLLVDIRSRRLGAANAEEVAGSYADYEEVCQDLEKSRALMRKLGCIIVRTDGRAIEESAQEILRFYKAFNLD